MLAVGPAIAKGERNPTSSHWRSVGRSIGAEHIHIDGSEATVRDSAADGTGESESRVEVETLGVGRVGSGGCRLDGIELGGAGGGGGSLGRHCDDGGEMEKKDGVESVVMMEG